MDAMLDLLKSFLPRIVQDILTSAAALLVAHGYIASSDVQGFVGSTFFLAMLIVNYVIDQSGKANAAAAGANTIGGALSPSQATAIAKTGKPLS